MDAGKAPSVAHNVNVTNVTGLSSPQYYCDYRLHQVSPDPGESRAGGFTPANTCFARSDRSSHSPGLTQSTTPSQVTSGPARPPAPLGLGILFDTEGRLTLFRIFLQNTLYLPG